MNKNNIDTAPTYTSRYDKPIKLRPNIIKYPAMLTKRPIKNNTETIGFLLIITQIAQSTDKNDRMFIAK
jgi:hypothetical protein